MPEFEVNREKPPLIASRLHLAVFLLIQIAIMLRGGAGMQRFLATADPEERQFRVACYLALAIVFQWAMVGFVRLGTRKTGTTLRELIGGRWATVWDIAKDIGLGLAFWFVWWIGFITFTLVSGVRSEPPDEVRALVPTTGWTLVLWIMVSVTAGFCEELMYRGYLQRQFLAMSGSTSIACIAQGLLFGAVHSYQGLSAVVVIAVMGTLFGALAVWRKSLRPGMISHMWYNAIIGVIAYLWIAYHRS